MLRLRERILQGRWSGATRQAAIEGAEQVLEQTSESPETPGPDLVLLVPTVGGLLSFEMRTFASVEPAGKYLQSFSPLELSDGIIAFWALEPESTDNGAIPKGAEAVVLIRDEMKADVVHLTSFLDMDPVQLFIDQEAQGGVSLDRILVYWAALVAIEIDADGSVSMSPSAPPATAERPAYEPLAEANAVEATLEIPAADLHEEGPPATAERPAYEPLAEANGIEATLEIPAATLHEEGPPATAERPAYEPLAKASAASPFADPDEPSIDAIVDEVRRVLRDRRWDAPSQPFAGFNSPPGKF